MKASNGFLALVATGTLILAGAIAPASAASVMTEAFLANVRPNIDFLDRSSRLALDNSSRGSVKSFAHSEAKEQTITANALLAWTQSNTVVGAVTAVTDADGVLVPAIGVTSVPVPDVVTGRSVAVDVPAPLTVTRETPAGSSLLPAGQEDLDRLSTRHGKSFDALYRSTQQSALRQLATLYAGYIENGDDPALRALSARELPKINRRLTELRRI